MQLPAVEHPKARTAAVERDTLTCKGTEMAGLLGRFAQREEHEKQVLTMKAAPAAVNEQMVATANTEPGI